MIRELFQKEWSITAISDETGFDPKTIRKYIKTDELPKRKSSQAISESKLDPYKEYLKTRIKEGTTNCSVLFDEIEALGIRDFVRPFRTKQVLRSKRLFDMRLLLENKLKWTGERLANTK